MQEDREIEEYNAEVKSRELDPEVKRLQKLEDEKKALEMHKHERELGFIKFYLLFVFSYIYICIFFLILLYYCYS